MWCWKSLTAEQKIRYRLLDAFAGRKKKADAAELFEMFHRVGLLTNELPGMCRAAVY